VKKLTIFPHSLLPKNTRLIKAALSFNKQIDNDIIITELPTPSEKRGEFLKKRGVCKKIRGVL